MSKRKKREVSLFDRYFSQLDEDTLREVVVDMIKKDCELSEESFDREAYESLDYESLLFVASFIKEEDFYRTFEYTL